VQQLGREPSRHEIAERIGLPEKQIREAMEAGQEALSLQTKVGAEGSGELIEFIEDERIEAPDKVAGHHELDELAHAALATLTPREQKILRLRFGIDDGRPLTLQQIGLEFGITRERVRQIILDVLVRLRKRGRARQKRLGRES
jgi:RNA polymerase primary sigma factor